MFNIKKLSARNGVWLWGATLALIYVLFGVTYVWETVTKNQQAHQAHQLRMTPGAVEPGRTPPDPVTTSGNFVNVSVGLYLDGIQDPTIRDSSWTGNFYIWFKWRGPVTLDPGKRFRIVGGEILEKETVESLLSTADGTHYQQYRVRARINKFFNTALFPLDNHMLTIQIEDNLHDVQTLRFIPDPGSNISSRVKIHSYAIKNWNQIVKNHTYLTNFGDPRATRNQRSTFSEYVFAIYIEKDGFAEYWMMFRGLFAGVLLALASLWIAASDTSPRFGLPSAAYFGAVANGYVIGSAMPPLDEFGLTSFISNLTVMSIGMCVVTSLISTHVYKKAINVSRTLDKLSFLIIALGYSVVNICLVFAATV